MPLPTFKNEPEFREKWIGPFLTKIGYILVTHSHGVDEQGKDFFFGEFDKFEHLRFHAIQAKIGNIGAGDVELQELLGQVKRAFTVRIKDRKGAEDRRISSVYVMTTGTISARAREYISGWSHTEHFGENVYFMDGDRLERLNLQMNFLNDNRLRPRLIGLRDEAIYNEGFADDVAAHLKSGMIPVKQFRESAINQYLAEPFLPHLNTIIDSVWTGLAYGKRLLEIELLKQSYQSYQAEHARRLYALKCMCMSLRENIEREIAKLDSLLSIEITTETD